MYTESNLKLEPKHQTFDKRRI